MTTRSKISSGIDFHKEENGTLMQYINCSKYDSHEENWVSLEELFKKEDFDFLDLLFIKMTGKQPGSAERRLFLRSLLITSLGTGCHPPSVMVPKLIASTTKNKEFAIINGLIGGMATIGTDHLGAVVECMRVFELLKRMASCSGDIRGAVEGYVGLKLANSEKIKGFGHPVYSRDPRPAMLLREIIQEYRDDINVRIYIQLSRAMFKKKGVHPNIDAALGLSYSIMGFEPEHGIYISFLSRSLSMVSHILEEFPKKPFSFLNEIVSIRDFYPAEEEEAEVNELIKSMWKKKSMIDEKKSIAIKAEVSG